MPGILYVFDSMKSRWDEKRLKGSKEKFNIFMKDFKEMNMMSKIHWNTAKKIVVLGGYQQKDYFNCGALLVAHAKEIIHFLFGRNNIEEFAYALRHAITCLLFNVFLYQCDHKENGYLMRNNPYNIIWKKIKLYVIFMMIIYC